MFLLEKLEVVDKSDRKMRVAVVGHHCGVNLS
jgi:hypothetical protein